MKPTAHVSSCLLGDNHDVNGRGDSPANNRVKEEVFADLEIIVAVNDKVSIRLGEARCNEVAILDELRNCVGRKCSPASTGLEVGDSVSADVNAQRAVVGDRVKGDSEDDLLDARFALENHRINVVSGRRKRPVETVSACCHKVFVLAMLDGENTRRRHWRLGERSSISDFRVIQHPAMLARLSFTGAVKVTSDRKSRPILSELPVQQSPKNCVGEH